MGCGRPPQRERSDRVSAPASRGEAERAPERAAEEGTDIGVAAVLEQSCVRYRSHELAKGLSYHAISWAAYFDRSLLLPVHAPFFPNCRTEEVDTVRSNPLYTVLLCPGLSGRAVSTEVLALGRAADWCPVNTFSPPEHRRHVISSRSIRTMRLLAAIWDVVSHAGAARLCATTIAAWQRGPEYSSASGYCERNDLTTQDAAASQQQIEMGLPQVSAAETIAPMVSRVP